uniref:Tyrosine-specific transport protein n=1 Tax=Oryza meridionalis TaxID=40149 RepID=A0A0E0CY67_9ORYZ
MQGAIARARLQHRPARFHRATYRCIPVTTTTRLLPERRVRAGGGGVQWCGSSAATGERARAVSEVRAAGARGGDARPPPQGDGDVAAGVAEAPSSGGRAKRGSVVGAAALVVGTSIGSGILAVPQRTAPAGFVPSAACMVTCWAFLVIEALILVEINVHLRRKKGKDAGGDGDGGGGQLEVISLKSMAQETLGEWGGNLAAAAYLFLSYTSMVAYTSKSGEVLSRVVAGVPEPVSGGAFTAALALLIAAGGTGVTDKVNQLLTFVMIGLLLTIEVSAVAFGAGLTLPANTNWEQVPATLPVIIFTLVFHDIAPVICAYLGGDLVRIRLSILVGSIVPLLSLLVWDDIALSISTDLDGFDILDMLNTE